jgi:hypothetical protein
MSTSSHQYYLVVVISHITFGVVAKIIINHHVISVVLIVGDVHKS